MRFCLGFQFLNEADWLRQHLPVILRASSIDGIVAVDGGSTDGSADVIREIAEDTPLTIERHDWKWNFAQQQNLVVQIAERQEYDAYFKWDPDELMFPGHIDQAARLLEKHKAVIVSRYNFEVDRWHYCPYLYPDKQLRFVRLNEGFYWSKRLHATTNAYSELWTEPAGTSPGIDRDIVWLSHVNIFHYEGLRPIEERALKWLNYKRVEAGETPLDALPDDHEVPALPVRYAVRFSGEKPNLPRY